MPKDFRKKTFQKILRGYSPDEVDAYLSYVNDEYKKLEKKNSENERKLALAAQKIKAYEFELNKNSSELKTEEELAAPIKEAEEKANAIIEKARGRGRDIVDGATKIAAEEAEKIITEADEYSAKVKGEADGLSKTANAMYNEILSFRDTMFDLYNSHIEQIEEFVNSADSFSERMDELYPDEDKAQDTEDMTKADESEYSEKYEEEYDEDAEESAEEAQQGSVTEEKAGGDIYIDLEDEIDEEESEQQYAANEALGLEDDEEETAEPAISDDDRERQRQLDRFFGILNDDELLSAEDETGDTEESDFEPDGTNEADDAPTRVLNIGEETKKSRQAQDSDFNESGDNSEGYVDMDSIFSGKEKRDMSLTDEFDIVYSDSSSKKSVDEIRKQPTIAASEPPKKNGKHFKK